MDRAHAAALDLVDKNREAVTAVAKALVSYSALSGAAVEAILAAGKSRVGTVSRARGRGWAGRSPGG